MRVLLARAAMRVRASAIDARDALSIVGETILLSLFAFSSPLTGSRARAAWRRRHGDHCRGRCVGGAAGGVGCEVQSVVEMGLELVRRVRAREESAFFCPAAAFT